MDDQLYEIKEGVRRAKAAWLCGRRTIKARVNGVGSVVLVPIECLLSPKTLISDTGPRGADWGGLYRATLRGEELPPIIILPGDFGTPIADVEVQADEPELFRQRYTSDQ